MKFLKLANMSEILGTMTIVGSLVFVGWQIHQSDQIARAEIEAAQGIMSIELAALISDHSDVWARGNAQDDLNDADSVVFENLVSALNDARFSVFRQVKENDTLESAMGYIHDFSGFLHRHPGVRQIWVERETNLRKYRNALDPSQVEGNSVYVDSILNDLDKLDRIQP